MNTTEMSKLYDEKRKNGKSHTDAYSEVGRLADTDFRQKQREQHNRNQINKTIDEHKNRNSWIHNAMKKRINTTLESKDFTMPEESKEKKEEVKRKVAEILAKKSVFETDCLSYHATTGADMDDDEFRSHLSVATMKKVEDYMEFQNHREIHRLIGTMKDPLMIDYDEYTKEKDANLYQADMETKKEIQRKWDQKNMIYPKSG